MHLVAEGIAGLPAQGNALLRCRTGKDANYFVEQMADGKGNFFQIEPAGLNLREVEDVVKNGEQALRRGL
ncbi:MAG: hypothetical protein JZU63_00555 [Rhodoferax sp.]|nr:hypothetical protein [Rhodoferax sp.]